MNFLNLFINEIEYNII